MANALVLSGFLAAATVATLAWGRVLWYVSERSPVLRRWVFLAMGRTRRPPGEIRAFLLSAIYYGLGLLVTLLFATAFRFSLSTITGFSRADVGSVILGAVGEISLASPLVEVRSRVTGVRISDRSAEIREIPWMKGLQQLPAMVVPVVAAMAGAVEETFFPRSPARHLDHPVEWLRRGWQLRSRELCSAWGS